MKAKEAIDEIMRMPSDAEITFAIPGQEPFTPNVVFFDEKEQEVVFTKVPETPVF